MKTQLRGEKLLERLSHHPLEKKKKDGVIAKKLSALKEFRTAKTVLFYLPIHGEVDLAWLLAKKMNKKFVLPRVKNETTLHLYYVKTQKDVEVGKFKILEPKKHLKRAAPKDIDLAFIPGIVFAKDGHRIGYGKGFYDRLLKKIRSPKIGVAYEFQIIDNIQGQPHDTPMDIIVSEKKILRPHHP